MRLSASPCETVSGTTFASDLREIYVSVNWAESAGSCDCHRVKPMLFDIQVGKTVAYAPIESIKGMAICRPKGFLDGQNGGKGVGLIRNSGLE